MCNWILKVIISGNFSDKDFYLILSEPIMIHAIKINNSYIITIEKVVISFHDQYPGQNKKDYYNCKS